MFEGKKHLFLIIVLCVLSLFTLMIGNDGVSLTHPDEVFYNQTAKEMIAHRSWLTPYLFGQPQFEKPILTYWLLIVAIKIFGLTAFAARFMPSLFGILGVLLTYWVAFLMFRKKTAAFLSAVVLSTSFIWVALSRSVLTDMIFSVLVTLSIAFFYYAYTNTKRKTLGLILFFATSGLAVLAKGVLGFIFPAGIMICYLIYHRDLKFLRSYATLAGFLLFLLIAIPWHWLMVQQFGKSFIEEYWQNVHVRRIFQAEHQKSNTWYFYLLTMFAGVFPWSLFLVPAGFLLNRVLRKEKELRPHFVFLFIWIGWVFFLMQIAQSKLSSYIFPFFPALAILLGFYFDRIFMSKPSLLSGDDREKVFHFIFSLMSGIALLVGCAVALYFVPKYGPAFHAVKAGCIFIGLLFICAVSVLIFTFKKDFVKSFWATSSLIGILLASLSFSYAAAEPWVSCKQICDVFKKIDPPQDVILTSKFYARGVHYYTDRPVAVIDINGSGFFSPHPIAFLSTDEQVIEFLKQRPVTYCIVKKNQWESLKRITQDKFNIIFFQEIGGKYILSIEQFKQASLK